MRVPGVRATDMRVPGVRATDMRVPGVRATDVRATDIKTEIFRFPLNQMPILNRLAENVIVANREREHGQQGT